MMPTVVHARHVSKAGFANPIAPWGNCAAPGLRMMTTTMCSRASAQNVAQTPTAIRAGCASMASAERMTSFATLGNPPAAFRQLVTMTTAATSSFVPSVARIRIAQEAIAVVATAPAR